MAHSCELILQRNREDLQWAGNANAYNVIKVFRQLGVSFEDICSLGCSIDGEPELKLTPALIALWYEEEKEEREAGTPEGAKSRLKQE